MYLNEAQISLTGYVATQPVTRTVKSGATNLSMRVAWTPRRQDRVTGEWTDGNTSYVTVICWRRLATNGAVCLRKGDPVVVKGRLSIRTYEDKQGMRKVAVEVEASSVGHDLSRGVAQFQRVRPQTGLTAAEFAAANGDGAHLELQGRADTAFSSGSDPLAPPSGDSGFPSRVEFRSPDDPGPDDPFFHDPDLAGSMSDDPAGARLAGEGATDNDPMGTGMGDSASTDSASTDSASTDSPGSDRAAKRVPVAAPF